MEFSVMVLVDQTDRAILDGLRRRPNPQSAGRLLQNVLEFHLRQKSYVREAHVITKEGEK